MTQNDNDRYHSAKSQHSEMKYMVWDFFGNESVAYCYTEEQADAVALAMSNSQNLEWSKSKNAFVDRKICSYKCDRGISCDICCRCSDHCFHH